MDLVISNEEIIEAIGAMTVNELGKFVEEFQAKFGVALMGPAVERVELPEMPGVIVEESSEFTLVLEATGPNTINVIKAVRELTKLGLKESKEKSAPGSEILVGVNKIEAESGKRRLEEAGATVAIRPSA